MTASANELDGVWRVVGKRPHHALRAIRDGQTWTLAASMIGPDTVYQLELRGGGFAVGRVGRDADRAELHGARVEAGQWQLRGDELQLDWSTGNLVAALSGEVERLARDDSAAAATEAWDRPSLPRARHVDRLGLVLDDGDRWHGRICFDGRRFVDATVSLVDGRDASDADTEAAFSEATRTVGLLHDGALVRAIHAVARDRLSDHREWCAALGHAAAATVDELASRIRLDSIAIDEHGFARLWFGGGVFSMHAIIAALDYHGVAVEIEPV